MSIGFEVKRAMLGFWRGSGLSRIGALRSLRKALIPDTRGWDAADLSLRGEDMPTPASPAPSSTLKDDSELANVQFWQKDTIRFPDVKISHRYWENAILLVNEEHPTEQEDALVKQIRADEEFLTFRKRNLWTLTVDDTPHALAPNATTHDLSRIIERFVSKSKALMQSIGFIIVVNPTNALGAAMRQCAYTAKLICVFTPDFDETPCPTCLEYADRIVRPMSLELTTPRPLNGVTEYTTSEQAFESLTSAIRDLLRKEFNMLLPAWHCMERIATIDALNESRSDLVVILNCSDADAPVVSGTFDTFVREIAAEAKGILASEELCQQYANLLTDLDDEETRSLFLLKTLQNGARCEFVYA
jgi:hypothetical protein